MARQRKVAFTEDAAGRVAKATLAYERGNRDQSPIRFRQVADDGEPVRIGKTSSQWLKGSIATIDLWEAGDAGSELSSGETLDGCVNKFADVASGKWVSVARGPFGAWYLIAAEC